MGLTPAYFDALKYYDSTIGKKTAAAQARYKELSKEYSEWYKKNGYQLWPKMAEYNAVQAIVQNSQVAHIASGTRSCGCGELSTPAIVLQTVTETFTQEDKEAMVAAILRTGVHPYFNIYQAPYEGQYIMFLDILRKFGAATICKYPNGNHANRLVYIMAWPGTVLQKGNIDLFDYVKDNLDGDFHRFIEKKPEKKAA
jgi:hypothetical protein